MYTKVGSLVIKMKFIKQNFTSSETDYIFDMIEEISREKFSDISEIFREIGLLLAEFQQSNEVIPFIKRFSDPAREPKYQLGQSICPDTRAISDCFPTEKKGCIWVLPENFLKENLQEQKCVIVHELCHLISGHSTYDLLVEMVSKYPKRHQGCVKVIKLCKQFFFEYEAIICSLKRFPYCVESIIPIKAYPDFADIENYYKQISSKTEALLFGLENSVKFLVLTKIYEFVSSNFTAQVSRFEEGKKYLEVQLGKMTETMEKDLPINLKEYINEELFQNRSIFLSRIMELLERAGYNT